MKRILSVVAAIGFSLVTQTSFAQNDTSTSIFSKNQKFDNEGVELYDTNLDMKAMKRIGVGLVAGGMTGMVGISGEFNIEPEHALFIGLGTGRGFNTFNFGYKRNFEGVYLSPYTKVGFSKWFDSSSSASGSANNSDILRQVLNDNEIRDNNFDVNFLAGGVGLEYNQLEGELSGVNFFGELLVMVEASSFKVLPTGSVGITYFY